MNVIISGTGGRGVSTFLDELLTQSAGNGTNWSSLDNATFIILLKVSANRYTFPNLSYFRWLVSLNSSFTMIACAINMIRPCFPLVL